MSLEKSLTSWASMSLYVNDKLGLHQFLLEGAFWGVLMIVGSAEMAYSRLSSVVPELCGAVSKNGFVLHPNVCSVCQAFMQARENWSLAELET